MKDTMLTFCSEEAHESFIAEDTKAGKNDADPSQVNIRRCAQTQCDFNFGKLQNVADNRMSFYFLVRLLFCFGAILSILIVTAEFLIPYDGDITPGMPIAAFGYPGRTYSFVF